jgi:hypothetical protein
MVPDIASKGHSFKGAMAYYLHDKRQDGAANPTTAERVAWTEMRNLACLTPDTAMRIMIATAKDADRLKAEAGIKNTGRKSNAHVYAYSLAWHPDEAAKLDRAEMVRAVDASLKALGADHLQAVLVCHRDQKHPHVHVVLNRVDPATGKMHAFSNDRLILSDWANAYERERGQILTPMREEKRQLREQFTDQAARREHVKNTPRDHSPAVMLKELGAAQKVAHGQQWKDLSAQHKAAKDAVYSSYGAKIAGAFEAHKAATKPEWAQHFRDARARERAFEIREQNFAGRIRNALDAVTHQQITGQAGDKGRLSLAFNNVLSSQARRAAFIQQEGMSRGEFTKAMRDRLDGQTTALKAERAAALVTLRDTFAADRAALIQKQDAERAKIRDAWAQLKNRTPPRTQTRDDSTRSESATSKTPRPWSYRKAQEDTRAAVIARNEKRAQQEKAAMKDAYDRNKVPPKPAPVQPTRTVNLSTPTPAPSPAGVTRPADRQPASVPVVDRAAQWAKTPEGQKVMRQQAPPSVPTVKKDWSKTASPATATPAPKKDWSRSAGTPAPAPTTTKAPELAPRKDWSAAANDKPREIKPLPPRDKSRDYDRER